MLGLPFARTFSCRQYFLHSFKQFRGNNWRKASVKPFVMMTNKSEIGAVRQHAFYGSFAKWRSFASRYTVKRQKVGERNQSMLTFGVFLKCFHNNLAMHWMRFDIPRTRIIHIAKGSFGEPLASPNFLAHPSLHILR
ncbi:MAG: hypothetical protein H6782_04210 [Candidatus Nomurabacteria bacterium]|nr:MAG: hypothetical protein H6782_04210 [Candidatus Nomurabacteria bacterium]